MNGRVVWCEVGGGSFIYRVLCCVQEISSFLLRLLSVIPCSGSPGPLTLPPIPDRSYLPKKTPQG